MEVRGRVHWKLDKKQSWKTDGLKKDRVALAQLKTKGIEMFKNLTHSGLFLDGPGLIRSRLENDGAQQWQLGLTHLAREDELKKPN